MKHFYSFAVALLLLPLAVTAQESPEDRYIAIYDLIQQADTLGESANPQTALPKYQEAQIGLKKFQGEFPNWNSKIVNFRLNYLATKIGPLGSKPATDSVTEAAAALKPAAPTPPPANLDNQIKALQDQLRQAQAEKSELEKRVEEAGKTVRASAEASQALTEAQNKIKSLQQDNERLKTDLKQSQAKVAPPGDTDLMDRASRALADAKSKLADQTKAVAALTQEKAGLQQRLEALAANPAGSAQLAALQQQLREIEAEKGDLQSRLKEAAARAAGNSDQLAKLDEKIKNLQKENSLLRASLEQRAAPTISTGDSFAAEQNKQALAEANRKLEEQAAQITALKAEREEFKKRLDAIASSDSLVKELASTKKELATLKRRFGVQTEAAILLLSEANIKIKQQGKASENMTRQMADLRKQMIAGNTNAELIIVLRGENELLKKQIAEIRKHDASAGKTTEPSAELLAAQSQAATLRARLNVLEAKSIPYTAEELALFNKPAISAATATPDAKAPPSLPHGAPELIADAQRLFAAHHLDEAEEKYQEVLKLDPKNVYTLANLATIQIEREDFSAAEKNLKQALALDPKDAFSLGVRGNMFFRQGKIDEALDSLSRAAQLDPNSAEIQNVLGITLSHKGQRGAAETALRKALQLDPNYGNAHNNLAVIYITQEPPLTELARWHYQKALTLGIGRNPDLEKLLETPAENKSGGDKK